MIVLVADILRGKVRHSGIYLIRDPAGSVVYVGRTNNLMFRMFGHRKRMTGGLKPGFDPHVWTVECRPGSAEDEAKLIAELQPMFNERHTDHAIPGRAKWLRARRKQTTKTKQRRVII